MLPSGGRLTAKPRSAMVAASSSIASQVSDMPMPAHCRLTGACGPSAGGWSSRVSTAVALPDSELPAAAFVAPAFVAPAFVAPASAPAAPAFALPPSAASSAACLRRAVAARSAAKDSMARARTTAEP